MSQNLAIAGAVLSLLVVFPFGSTCDADMITFMIGDDDGFGGMQGSNSDPGDPYSPFANPSMPPGHYINEAGLDQISDPRGYDNVFEFVFAYDTSLFASISTATVTIQSGSVGRRSEGLDPGSGYGYATVTANGGSGFIGLGDFWSTPTGVRGSALEESVKAHVFDVTSLITLSNSGSLTFIIDGPDFPDGSDQFALDFAQLTIVGDPQTTAVPEPASIALLTFTASGLGFLRLQKRRRTADGDR